MADVFNVGDRVVLRNGETGTILRIDDGSVHLQLDSSVRKTTAAAALKKIDGDKPVLPEDHRD